MNERSSEAPWTIIDVHTHVRPPWWNGPTLPPSTPERERERWRERARRLKDIDGLIAESEAGDVQRRLLSAPAEGVFGTDAPASPDEIAHLNDHLAELSARHPTRLAAFATIDAYGGSAAAREVERAVVQLGHVGVVIDSSHGGHFAGEDIALPVLEAAAALKVPVFVHPVAAPDAKRLIATAGVPGNAQGRGFMSGIALLSLLHAGRLDQFSDLHLIFAGIGAGALAFAWSESHQYGQSGEARGEARPNIYFDFMGLDPSLLRFLVGVLGAEHIIVGSDWPIWETATRSALTTAFAAAGLSDEEQHLIAEGNARRLFRLGA